MPAKKKTIQSTTPKKNKSKEPFEQQLFKAADKLRKNIDAAEYKHVVLGLIFLKYISDAFVQHREKLQTGKIDYFKPKIHNLEDRDYYTGEGVFWVPSKARWEIIHTHSKKPTIGKTLDRAMETIEKENGPLRGILPKIYAKENLDQQTLGGLIDLISDTALADTIAQSKDLLGRVYEYFLGQFANAEGKKGGQFYTPKSIVRLMVEMIEPYQGRVYDPACGSGGMFVMSEKFVQEHGGGLDDLSLYGQESNQTTWKLSRMNLAIRGIDGSGILWNAEGFFMKDEHPDLKADYIIANPPFNQDEWGIDLLQGDARWQYGTPPKGNANYGWIQHMLYHTAPQEVCSLVLANGSLSSNQSGEGQIREALVGANLVDSIVALPKQLFYNTGIPACLWFLRRGRTNTETLFMDASNMGFMEDRTHRAFALAVPSCEANQARDKVAFFQAIKARLIKFDGGITQSGRTSVEIESAVRQLIDQAIVSEGVVDIFDAAGIKKPDISILSDEFMDEIRNMEQKNLAVELLRKLLQDEIKTRTKRNAIQSKKLSELLNNAIRKYQNRVLSNAEKIQKVIDELIEIGKEIKASDQEAKEAGLSDNEYAFYMALADNDSAEEVMGKNRLKYLATVLVNLVREQTSIDWTKRERIRSKLRALVKSKLLEYGYPPDMQKMATENILIQATLLAKELARK